VILRHLRRAGLKIHFCTGRAELYRDLAEMFRRNEALVSFLEGEIANADLARQRARKRALRRMLQVHITGENASALSHLLADVSPRSDAMMLLAVDRSPDKSVALRAIAEAVDQQGAMLHVVGKACLLPLVTLPICYVLVSMLGQVVLAIDQATPDFVREALWQGMNGWARTMALSLDAHGGALAAVGLLLLLAIVGCLPRWSGAWRARVESWPLFSLYRDFQAGMLLSSLAMMLRSGQTLQASLEDVAQRASPWMRWHLTRVLVALDESPNAVLDAFRHGVLSRRLLARAMTLNRSSQTFSDVLVELGTREGERVLAQVKATAQAAHVAVVATLAGCAVFMGVASITVMEPSTLMMLKARHDAEQRSSHSSP
jgi:type II secretory pathway component PulF